MIIDPTFARRVAENLVHCAHERASQDDANTKIISDALDAHANWATQAMRLKQERLDKECSALHRELARANALLKESRGFTEQARKHGDARVRELEAKLSAQEMKYAELGAEANRLRQAVKEPRDDFQRRQKVIDDLREERAKMIIELGQMRPQLNAVDMMTRNVAKISGESVSDAMCRYLKSLYGKLKELKKENAGLHASLPVSSDRTRSMAQNLLGQSSSHYDCPITGATHPCVDYAKAGQVVNGLLVEIEALKKALERVERDKEQHRQKLRQERDNLQDKLKLALYELAESKKWDKTGADYIQNLSEQIDKHQADISALIRIRSALEAIGASQKAEINELHERLTKVAEILQLG